MLIVVRHGRTEANAQGLLLGRADPALDEVGRAQAAAVAAAVGPVDRVVSSPLARCRETAAQFTASGGPVEIDDRWIELDYGDLDGRSAAEVPTATWRAWRADPSFAPPHGESLASLFVRVAAALDDLRAAAGRQTIVVVTHVSPVKAALAWSLGAGPEVSWRAYVAPSAVMRIAVGDQGPSLHSFNDINHCP